MRDKITRLTTRENPYDWHQEFTQFVAWVCIHTLGWRIFGGFVRDYICAGVTPSDLDVYFDGYETSDSAIRALQKRFPGSSWKFEEGNKVSGTFQCQDRSVEMDFVNPAAPDIVNNVDFDVNALLISKYGVEKRCSLEDRAIPLIIGNTRLRRCAIWDERHTIMVINQHGREEEFNRAAYMLDRRLAKMIRKKGFYVVNLDLWIKKMRPYLENEKVHLRNAALELIAANQQLSSANQKNKPRN
jgi:hypothetical protein